MNSALYLPLLRDGECIGLLTLVGKRPNTFGAAEIAQAQSFRDQALIAIENVRLFEAEQQRTRELRSRLSSRRRRRRYSGDRSSPGDLQPVFAAMLENAVGFATRSSATFIAGMASFFTFLPRSTHHRPLSKPARVHRFDPHGLCIAWWKAKRRYTLPISRRMRITLKNTIDLPQRQSNLGACGRFCLFQCSRRMT